MRIGERNVSIISKYRKLDELDRSIYRIEVLSMWLGTAKDLCGIGGYRYGKNRREFRFM